MRALAILALLGAGTGTAIAQPALAPVSPRPSHAEPSLKRESTALWLSLGGTGAALGMIALAGADPDGNTLATLGAVGLSLAPTAGHWYAGRAGTLGLGLRAAGAGAMLLGVAMNRCFDAACDDPVGTRLLALGAAAFVIGGVHDIVTAPRSARRYNARVRARRDGLALVPTLGGRHAGLVVAGRF